MLTTTCTSCPLGRRYLRLFSFIDCFSRASTLLSRSSDLDFDSDSDDLSPSRSTPSDTVLNTLELVNSSCLGIYLLLENLTIVSISFLTPFPLSSVYLTSLSLLPIHPPNPDCTQLHDMTIWPVPWSTPVLLEANKFWFYAICASITGAVLQLPFPASTTTETQTQSRKDQTRNQSTLNPSSSSSSTTSTSSKLLAQILVDGCDLTLPASFLGWTPALGDLGVGIAMVVSTVLASRDVWIKAQR